MDSNPLSSKSVEEISTATKYLNYPDLTFFFFFNNINKLPEEILFACTSEFESGDLSSFTEHSSGSVTNSHSGNRNTFTAEEAIGQNVKEHKVNCNCLFMEWIQDLNSWDMIYL